MKALLVAVSLLVFPPLFAQSMTAHAPPVPSSPRSVDEKINLNKATEAMLIGSFKGIGQKRAKAIVQYRETHGEFKSIQDLAHVRGLGASFIDTHLEALQKKFTVE